MNIFTVRHPWREVERWLWQNVGDGGQWLTTLPPEARPLPEEGDEWGTWFTLTWGRSVAIKDDSKALLFALRWTQ